jgi:quinol monooxygenase YgiN
MALQVSTVNGAEQCELSQAAAQAISSLQKQVVTMGMADEPGCHQFQLVQSPQP